MLQLRAAFELLSTSSARPFFAKIDKSTLFELFALHVDKHWRSASSAIQAYNLPCSRNRNSVRQCRAYLAKKRVRYPHDGTNLCLCFGGKVECQYLFVLSESCGVSDKYIVTCSSSFQERGETRDESHWNTSMSRPACRDQEVASTATRTFVARILRWLQCHFFDSHQSPFTMQETSYAGQWCFRADHCFSVIDTR